MVADRSNLPPGWTLRRLVTAAAALVTIAAVFAVVAVARGEGGSRAAAADAASDRWCTRAPAISQLGKLRAESLSEVSGLAAGFRHPKVLWAHNDSGDGARFFALDLTGRRLGTHRLAGVDAVDWEDMASAPAAGGGGVLAFADIGDNTRSRPSVSVYRVPEPADPTRSGTITGVESFVLTYPDGPRDAEAFTIGADGSFWIVEKTLLKPAGVYRLPAGVAPGAHTLKRVGEVPGSAGPVTAAVGLVGSQEVVLRTLLGFEVYAATANPSIGGRPACRFRGPPERQGEAVARLADGRLVTVGEGREVPIWAIRPG